MPDTLNPPGIRRQAVRAALIGVSTAAILAGTVPGTAVAQPAPPAGGDTLEEIVITGIRGSLRRASDIKRNSDVVVDSISAESLGKFPDSNVAESLQRITGVSIDRSGGEGQFVTVRGFGPQFNTVLVNGRTIASENAGREFSFDLLAAELITGADVFKSSSAGFQEGGIGSTINLKTARPFDIKGMKFIGTAKGVYEKNSENVAPQGFALFSNTFDNQRFGVLASVSYQKRDARTNQLETRGFNSGQSLPLVTGAPTNVFVPQNYDQIINEEERERIGVNGVVQYQATDDLVLTVDGLWNRFEVDSRANSIGHWFTPSNITAATIDSNRSVTRLTQGNGFSDFIQRTFNRPTKIQAAGFNADWEASDQIKVTFDQSWSKASLDNGGNETFAVIGAANTYVYDNTRGGVPSLTTIPANNFTNPALGRAHIAIREGSDISDEIYESRLDSEWETEYEHFKRLRIGGLFSDRTKDNRLVQTDPNTLCLYCGYQVDVPDNLLRPYNAGSVFGSADVPRNFLSYDPEALFAFLESAQAASARDAALGLPAGTTAGLLRGSNGFTAAVQPASFDVGERIFAGYVEADFEGVIGGKPWTVNLGARYVHTETDASGVQRTLLDLQRVVGDATIYNAVFSTGNQPVSRDGSYDKFLPSLNARVEFTDQIIGRFAMSRTMTRPELVDLAPRLNFDVVRPGNLLASGGNTELQPYTSDNLDATFEWYYQDAGYFTVGAFYKQIDDYIVSTVANETVRVANGSNLPEFAGGNATFSVRRPRNAETAEVYGLEVAFQHIFDYLPEPFDGLGFTVNATFVDSNVTLDPGSGSTFALEGLGDSQNAVLFYENDFIEARIAYNRRESFLQTAVNGTGGDPVFVKTYEQWDAQARYIINENFSVFVEGVNIFGEDVGRHGRFSNQFLGVVDTGARYSAGVRAEF
ncbi:MAG: hypothetical protein RLY86_1117 [Pseudomonadota bacterium]|jgi:TonB-dependent receptor